MAQCLVMQCLAVLAAMTVTVTAAAAQVVQSQNSPNDGPGAYNNATPPSIGTTEATTPAPVANGLAWQHDQLTLTLANGNFTISPAVRIDADAVSFFGQNGAGGYRSGTEFRRNRYGVRGTFLKDFDYAFIWEFGGRPKTPNTLLEAEVGWSGLGWGTVRVGAFTPQYLPEYASSSYDTLFLERAAISNIAASIAAGDAREAVGLEARGARWNASFYVSGGTASTRNTSKQRGLVARAVVLAVNRPGAQLQIGFDGSAQFAPGRVGNPDAITFSDFPELRGITGLRLLNTGPILADTAYAIGPEIEGRAGPAYFEALYQHVGVDVTDGGSRSFEGWYMQAAVPLLGPPRERVGTTGTWGRPKTQGWVNPLAGNWGAIEAVARYSTADLQDGATRGGRQRIWAVGANWYLSPNFKIDAEYETGRVDLDTGDRKFQGVGFRASFNL